MTATSGLDRQRERAAKNQSLFRDVNERLEDLAASAMFPAFVCECADRTCTQTLSLTLEEYEHVRSESSHFVVAVGHEVPAVESVVDATSRFLIVSKLGVARGVADELDPRKRGRP